MRSRVSPITDWRRLSMRLQLRSGFFSPLTISVFELVGWSGSILTLRVPVRSRYPLGLRVYPCAPIALVALWSKLSVTIQLPARRPTWAALVSCHCYRALRSCTFVIANRGQPRRLFAGFRTKDFYRACRRGRSKNCYGQNHPHLSPVFPKIHFATTAGFAPAIHSGNCV